MKAYRKLGRRQYGCLRGLVEHYSWSPGCGWSWGSALTTERLLERLVARGLASRSKVRFRGEERPIYTPTSGGIKYLKENAYPTRVTR